MFHKMRGSRRSGNDSGSGQKHPGCFDRALARRRQGVPACDRHDNGRSAHRQPVWCGWLALQPFGTCFCQQCWQAFAFRAVFHGLHLTSSMMTKSVPRKVPAWQQARANVQRWPQPGQTQDIRRLVLCAHDHGQRADK